MKKKLLPVLLALLVTLLSFWGFAFYADNARYLEEMRQLSQVTERMSGILSNAFAYTDIMELSVRYREGDYSQEDFQALAEMAMKQNTCISSVQLAPDEVVSFIYPLEGNEAAMGHRLLEDEERKAWVEAAIESENVVTQGPVESVQGKLLIFGRKAIRVNGELWGLAVIAVDFEQLVESCGITPEQLELKCSVERLEEDGSLTHVWGSETTAESRVIYTDVHIPGQQLRVSVQQKMTLGKLLGGYGLILLISLLLGVAMYAITSHYRRRVLASRTDPLTKTLNRAEFTRRTERALRRGQSFALLNIDLDQFKEINDTYGHLMGDTILIHVADRMKQVLREGDFISRVGGDEFLVLVHNLSDVERLPPVLNRLRDAVEQNIQLGERQDVRAGLSIGYALCPKEGKDFQTLYQLADDRMYEDKSRRKAARETEEA